MAFLTSSPENSGDRQDGVMGISGGVAAEPGEVVRQLRSVLDAVDAGELPAGPDQRAWLRGAVDVLDVLAGAEAVPADAAGPVSEP